MVEREAKSSWFDFHTRQALTFGLIVTFFWLVALIWPLVASLLLGNLTATVVLYVLALVIDVALFVFCLIRAVGYSKRTARGETFEVPIVAEWNRRVGAKR